jgi:serine/threonine-protein kinase
VREAALALERAHARGLVHGDVRPANLVVPASGGGVLRVRGWSLVRARIEALDARRPEGTPELSLGPGDDVSGLAGTLHAVLWGHLPREGKAARAGRDVPAELVSIVGRGLAPRPEQRFRSAAELAEDLRRYLDGEEVRAHRATLSGARAVLYSARSSLLGRRRGARADEEERAP